MISFLGSEVGRGHPFYLDGVRRALRSAGRADLIREETDVFRVSHGTSRLAWQGVRAAYGIAGRGGVASDLYHRLRSGADYNDESSLALRVLGRDVRRWAAEQEIVVVDHPAVVGALGRRPDVWYVHGEVVAPPESVVHGAARVFVPFEETAGDFVRGGVHPDRVIVTGVCVENELVPGGLDGIQARRERIAGAGALTVGFFSSGAEPPAHVEALAAGAAALARDGRHRAVIFARRGGRLHAFVTRTVESPDLVLHSGREELDRLTAARFPVLDVVASPPHERSNWAVALGTPFLLVGPDVGPFAPRNRDFLLRRGVAVGLDRVAARALPAFLDELRGSGRLLRMSEEGAGVPFRGFEQAARRLVEECERRKGG
jgi:hypothetical protein